MILLDPGRRTSGDTVEDESSSTDPRPAGIGADDGADPASASTVSVTASRTRSAADGTGAADTMNTSVSPLRTAPGPRPGPRGRDRHPHPRIRRGARAPRRRPRSRTRARSAPAPAPGSPRPAPGRRCAPRPRRSQGPPDRRASSPTCPRGMGVDPSNARRTGQINSNHLSDPRGPLQSGVKLQSRLTQRLREPDRNGSSLALQRERSTPDRTRRIALK